MPNANNQNTVQKTGIQYGPGVGNIMSATLPIMGASGANATPQSSTATASTGVYTGPFAGRTFLSEPFAVWLGMIIVLVGLKFLSEHPKTGINPAKIEIGGYNFITIGVSAAIFITIFKVLFNRIKLPGVTEFANAL